MTTVREWVPSMTVPPLPEDSARRDVTVLICTYNRAQDLGSTLDSLAAVRLDPPLTWDVIVVDNNSTDDTRAVVARFEASFPVPLRYLFEPVQGKSNALNTGLRAATGRLIAFTDDDVRVPPEWLQQSIAPLLRDPALAYTGGAVRPIWRGRQPVWLDAAGNLGGTIAVKDHGAAAFVFEDRKKTPLGVNMTVRRALIERIGGFHPDLGRTGESLLGQEQADFFYRSRRSGARGLYVPDAILEHVVPAARLNLRYFRRWWYWKGVSHARLHALHGETELGLDVTQVPRVWGVPRFVVSAFARHLRGWIGATIRRDRGARAEHWFKMAYAIGYARESYRERPLSTAARATLATR